MIKLRFVKNRANDQRFIVRITKPHAINPDSFMNNAHPFQKIELVGPGVVISSAQGEITWQSKPVKQGVSQILATEFVISPPPEKLAAITDGKFEVVLDDAERLGFVDIQVVE